LLGID
jgi:hypothetical protein